jgi:hypothetical protein
MSISRFVLVVLICASPAILLWDGLVTQGIVAGIVALGLAITALVLRPGETGFLISIVRPLMVIAAVPALWIAIQALPLGILAHPIWTSAAQALRSGVPGAISIDPGSTVIALGQYLSMIAIALLSAAVAADRQRAESILFALTTAVAAIALLTLAHDLFLPGAWFTTSARPLAIDCAAVGTIVASAACIRTVDRAKRRHGGSPQSSGPRLAWTLLACGASIVICVAALLVDAPRESLFATGLGLLALASVSIIRRFEFGPLGIAGITLPILGAAILLVAAQPLASGLSVTLAFAEPSSHPLVALNQRMLDDAPLVGTGAGTLAALAPVYREMNDPPAGAAATAAASFTTELGRPMLWLIVAVTAGAIVTLLRASLRRGRDAFYPAMGASCLITQLFLGFTNAGLLGTATSLIMASALGLSFAQSKSRTAHQ